LSSIVEFPTRIGLRSITAIDNIFVDISAVGKYDIYPITNGLSDHEAQLLVIYKIQTQRNENQTYFKRKMNEYHIADFQLNLSYETWEMVFDEKDVKTIFNTFLNIFVRIIRVFH
jgi:hypothetical protein